jgi:hypothetical protein
MAGYTIDDPPRDESLTQRKDGSSRDVNEKSIKAEKGRSSAASSRSTLVEPPAPIPSGIDRIIDDLLDLTQEPTSTLCANGERPMVNIELLSQFHERLRERLEEVPHRLGPAIFSSQVLRVAYAACQHLNWGVFNLSPRVITAAITADALRSASALTLCVDEQVLEESYLNDLAAALAQSTSLRQIFLVRRPGRKDNDIPTRLCSQLLELWERESKKHLERRIIQSTSAFSSGLRSLESITPPSTIGSSSTSSGVTAFPMIHIFLFNSKDSASPGDTRHYSLENTLLTAEHFAVRFLAYLRALGPDMEPDKAILRLAYDWGTSVLTPSHDGTSYGPTDHVTASSPAPDELGVSPIPIGFFQSNSTAQDKTRVRLGDIPSGSWVVLMDRRDLRQERSDDKALLRYTFIRIPRSSADTEPGEQQQVAPGTVEVVGGLIDFLQATVPDIDVPTWETRLDQVKKDVAKAYTKMTQPKPKSLSGLGVKTWLRQIVERYPREAEPDVQDEFLEQAVVQTHLLMDPAVRGKVEMVERCIIIIRVIDESLAHTFLDRLL